MSLRLRSALLALAWLAATACGADAPDGGATEATAGGDAAEAPPQPLDWALMLPIETDGLIRVDLARLRRSPHRAAIEPLLEDALGDLGDPGLQEAFRGLLERTDVVLLAMLPDAPGSEGEMVALASGDYHADEIQQLNAASQAPEQSAPIEVRGQTVWVDRSGSEPVALAQIRPGTLALTSSVNRMDRLLARMTMEQTGPRWPPAVRGLVEGASLDGSTISVVLSRDSFQEGPEGLSMAIAGRADVDGPLEVQVVLDFEEPAMAQMAAMVFEGMVQGMAQSTEPEAFALRRLASLARIEARGNQVVGSLSADAATAAQLIPSLVELLTQDDAPDDTATPPGATPL